MSLPGLEIGARPKGVACRAAAIPKLELKNKTLDTMILKYFTSFSLQPNSATEIDWWQYIRILKNKIKSWDFFEETKQNITQLDMAI